MVVQADGAEGHRHALPGPQGGAIHQLGMHVGFGAVARIAAVADLLARGHPPADADGQRSALQVRNRGVDAVVTADGDLVADHEARPAQFPDRRLDQQVHDAEQVRACPVVASPVGCLDDRAVDHRQHGLPQTRVFLGGTHRLTTERRTRVLGGFVGEIDRVGLPVGSQPMAGDPCGETVQGDPSAPHRRVHSASRRDRKQPRREEREQDARHETQ
ncbi:hypothetical protein SDC9_165287 [bioreactor metagenome]|uniref:Uncharacterized protein n=1 Tax=bioreactor metagenome TaxID=1076179 RepID=A0A645FW78_9ZZZZ